MWKTFGLCLLLSIVADISAPAYATPAALIKDPQERLVRFAKIGMVSIRIIEADRKLPRLEFSDSASGKVLLTVSVGTPDPDNIRASPRLRFKEISIDGLPAPIIVGVALAEGASSCNFDAVVIGEVKGRLKVLTQAPLHTGEGGGIYVGKLGGRRGSGIAVWTFVWGDREAHADPHRYKVKFYPWSARTSRFANGGELITRSKYARSEAALAELKLSFVDLLGAFPDFADCR